jgi:hypothetical protein
LSNKLSYSGGTSKRDFLDAKVSVLTGIILFPISGVAPFNSQGLAWL